MSQKKRTPFRPPQNKASTEDKSVAGRPSKTPRGTHAEEVLPQRESGRRVAESSRPQRSRPVTDVDDEHHESPADDGTEKLHKVLARSGLGSRRDMEAAILAGRVTINGRPAEVGDRVAPTDRILFDHRPIRKPKPDELPRILIYHKPEGEIVSRDDPEGRTTVFDKLPRVRGGKWVSIGRLDYNTSGLLVFTTSGELANRLSHPRFEVEREYAVRVMGELSSEQCKQLCNGVELDDGLAKFEWLRDDGGEGSNHWYRVMLREGRNREVRRMFSVMNVMVSRLMRVRFGVINLPPRLKRGTLLELEEKQVKMVLAWAGIDTTDGAPAGKPRSKSREEAPAPKERRAIPRNPRAGQTKTRIRGGGGKP